MAKDPMAPLSFQGQEVVHSWASLVRKSRASQAEARKVIKYANFGHTHLFTPVAIETLGVWGPGATELAEQHWNKVEPVWNNSGTRIEHSRKEGEQEWNRVEKEGSKSETE